MNNDVIHAHALGVAITDADLAEIEAQIESARPRPQYEGNSVISGGTRYCLASKRRNDPAPEAFDPPSSGIMVDALIQEFAGERYLIKPFSHRAVLWFNEHLPRHRTTNGYMFASKRELGLTSSANFSYRMIDSDGYPL
jgi:hypothetical protein